MDEASEAGNFFNPNVKNVCPACVNIPIPMIQLKTFKVGVIQLRNTIGNNIIIEINGKYLIIMKISSVKESFFTVM